MKRNVSNGELITVDLSVKQLERIYSDAVATLRWVGPLLGRDVPLTNKEKKRRKYTQKGNLQGV